MNWIRGIILTMQAALSSDTFGKIFASIGFIFIFIIIENMDSFFYYNFILTNRKLQKHNTQFSFVLRFLQFVSPSGLSPLTITYMLQTQYNIFIT